MPETDIVKLSREIEDVIAAIEALPPAIRYWGSLQSYMKRWAFAWCCGICGREERRHKRKPLRDTPWTPPSHR